MFKWIRVWVRVLLAAPVALVAATVTEYSRQTPVGYTPSNQRHGNLPFSLQTPRIEWARPCVLGKMKLLAVLPVAATREAVELASRLEAEVKVVNLKEHGTWWSPGESQFYNSTPLEEALNDNAARLLSAAYKYDAIIIGHVKWSAIPENIRKLVVGRVKGGTALVFVSPWDIDDAMQKEIGFGSPDNPLAERVRDSVPLGVLPLDMDLEPLYPKPFEPRRVGPMRIRLGRLGEGSVVALDYNDNLLKDGRRIADTRTYWSFYAKETALTPFVEDDDLFYDYYHSILAKVILGAAGKETGISIRPERIELAVGQKELPGSPLGFTLSSGSGGPRDMTFYFELRDRQNKVVTKGESPIAARFAPEVPFLAQGLYILDVWVKSGGMIRDWASAALRVTGVEHVEAIVPDKEFFGRDEAIGGTVKFKTPPDGVVSTRLELWDTHNRLERTAEPIVKTGKFQFKRIELPLSRTYRIVCAVSEKDVVLERKEVWVGLPTSTVDDFQFVIWASAYNTRGNRTLMRLCKEQAVTAYYESNLFSPRRLKFQSADALARNNLLALPYTSGCWGFAGEGGPWSGEEQYRQYVAPAAEAYRRYGAMAYSICEENSISKDEEAWGKALPINDYHRYLRERYADVGRLNEIWGTRFTGFEEIGLVTFQEAKAGRQFTRWMEQQRHRVDRFTAAHELSRRLLRDLDPGARASLDCVSEMYDWQRIAKSVQSWSTCGGTWCPFDRWMEKGKDNLSAGEWSGWYPPTINEWCARTRPWQDLFLGRTHVLWWSGDAFGFTPDRSEPMLCLSQTASECREIESGVGKLLLGSQKRIDPILILWSQPSYYASVINPAELAWNQSRETFVSMLRHSGLDYQFVGEGFLENDLVYGDRQRVLILPASQAISRKGVERVKAFALDGGLVMADCPPAGLDEYLRPHIAPTAAAGEKVEFQACPKCGGKKRIQVDGFWQGCPACGGAGIVAKGGDVRLRSALEDMFDFSKRGAKAYGKGHGLFLAGSPKPEEWAGLRKSLVETQGARGDVEVLDALGNLRVDLNWHVFDNGRARLVGIVPPLAINTPPGTEFTVRLKERRHGYNVRLNKYLGLADTFQSGTTPYEPKLLAFLPERIEGVRLSTPKNDYRPGGTVEIVFAVLPESLGDSHLVLRVEVRKGDKLLSEHSKNVGVRGAGRHAIPLALNQEPGEYRVRATEIISGHMREITFRVK